MKKIAIISDIHSNIYALNAVLEDIRNRNIDEIYCVGDSVGYNTRPNEVCEKLREKNIKSVLGNHDEGTAFYDESQPSEKNGVITPKKWTFDTITSENIEYLKSLPREISLDVNGKHILITHGSPNGISDYIFENDTEKQEEIAKNLKEDAIIFGHTHNIYKKEVSGKLFVNAGSVGRPKDGDNRSSYVILSVSDKIDAEFIRVSYDFETLAKELETSPLPNSFAEVIRTGIEKK